ncbi:DNA-binding protein [Alicyclobacillus contaminans]|uniref:metal-dependent transcriptional regulator n=1 Tax=Alicyclobacillus contaminans TaxID=392016 RepID=UPI0005500E8A|nr:metal-dependent transcriptional regulator [Alicyclobacillus contaminans]GMA51961.1 DNA-binding protein [Alicyclobacillus contaminans]
MPRTHGLEEYLEAIYVLTTEGEVVLPSVLADYLNVSRPTVTQTVQRMTAAGLVAPGESRAIVLTPEGTRRAEVIVRRHRLLERWLSDELGLDWADAHVEAGRLEHALSPLVEERLFEKLGRPKTCPHGNIIPGSGAQWEKGIPLTDVAPPARVQVVRIYEQAEEDLDLLRFLHRAGIVPGADIFIPDGRSAFEAGVPIEVGGSSYSLDENVARRILVRLLTSTIRSSADSTT